MRISKDKAYAIAKEVAKPLSDKADAAQKVLDNKARSIAEKGIPKDVLALHAKQPKYFNEVSCVYLKGPGIVRYISATFENALPLPSSNVELTTTQANEIVKLNDKIDELRAAHKETVKRIEVALIGLGTYARIKEQLPEVVPFLPEPTNTAVALPIKEIRKEIKALTA